MPAWAPVDPGPDTCPIERDLVFTPRDTPHSFTVMGQQAVPLPAHQHSRASPAKSRRRRQRRNPSMRQLWPDRHQGD